MKDTRGVSAYDFSAQYVSVPARVRAAGLLELLNGGQPGVAAAPRPAEESAQADLDCLAIYATPLRHSV